MTGYTPVFRSIFEGSLCGQWPYTAGWLIFLSLTDQHGNVDMTPEYISRITGMPIDDLTRCIERFLAPDPASRSKDEEGRRLVPLDAERSWGWHVVNHTKYREKARLMSKNAREVESGNNAERMKTAAHRRSPPPTPSHTHTQTKTKKEKKEGASAPQFDPALVNGLNLEAWSLWVEHRIEIKKPIRPHSLRDAAEELAKLGGQQLAEVKRARAAGWQGIHPEKPTAQAQKTSNGMPSMN